MAEIDQAPEQVLSALPSIRTEVEIPLGPQHIKARFHTFTNLTGGGEHLLIAFGRGDVAIPLVRIHSECMTGDVFGSTRCDCGQQLSAAIELLARDGGYLLYLRQEGRGIGLYAKLEAYRLQDLGLDTFEANRQLGFRDDLREYTAAAEMLRALGVTEVRLITNNPDKIFQLEKNGIRVRERVATPTYVTRFNLRYLTAKVIHKNHLFELD